MLDRKVLPLLEDDSKIPRFVQVDNRLAFGKIVSTKAVERWLAITSRKMEKLVQVERVAGKWSDSR